MSHVAGQIGKIATRAANVVAGRTMPSRADKHVPDLAEIRKDSAIIGMVWSSAKAVFRAVVLIWPLCANCGRSRGVA